MFMKNKLYKQDTVVAHQLDMGRPTGSSMGTPLTTGPFEIWLQCQRKVIQDSNLHFRIDPDVHQIVPKMKWI